MKKKKYKKGEEEEMKALTKTETMAQPTHSHQGEVCLDVKMKTFGDSEEKNEEYRNIQNMLHEGGWLCESERGEEEC